MPETILSPDYFRKDAVPMPLPAPRAVGLTRLLGGLDVGESAIVPRRSTNDLHKTGAALNMTFTARRLDAEWSRVWRTA
jgi:hypothetical protein